MPRTKTNKLELTGLKTNYDLVTASNLLQKDHRTIKNFCQKNNIELLKINNRYYITEQQLNYLKENLQ